MQLVLIAKRQRCERKRLVTRHVFSIKAQSHIYFQPSVLYTNVKLMLIGPSIRVLSGKLYELNSAVTTSLIFHSFHETASHIE